MKQLFWIFLVGSLLMGFRSTSQTIGKKETTPEIENSLLWEIEGKGLDKTSYLFGTIHMIGKEDFVLTAPTQKAFDDSERVAFEIDLEEMMDVSAMMPLMMKAFMANDTTLSDLLTEEQYTKVDKHFQKLGIPLMFLERLKPMFLSMMASEDLTTGQATGDIVSYEMKLMERANSQSKEIDGLETAEFQMSMFDSIPYKIQAQMLMDALEGTGDGNSADFDLMVDLYKKQDIAAMQQLMEGDGTLAQYEDLLLVQRNKNWIPIMADMMAKNSIFFAVGAGHLGGQMGVVNLLRQAGYIVKPIK
ncbi:MAG: TraB/GumN family protein [Saprospiraceae bacterium]|nr:TraB/GumN family protein [Saprospiraceae bacterium]